MAVLSTTPRHLLARVVTRREFYPAGHEPLWSAKGAAFNILTLLLQLTTAFERAPWLRPRGKSSEGPQEKQPSRYPARLRLNRVASKFSREAASHRGIAATADPRHLSHYEWIQ